MEFETNFLRRKNFTNWTRWLYRGWIFFLSTFRVLPTNDKFPEFTWLGWLMCACSNIWYDSIKAVMYHLKKFKHTFLRWSKSYLNINHELKIKLCISFFYVLYIFELKWLAMHFIYILQMCMKETLIQHCERIRMSFCQMSYVMVPSTFIQMTIRRKWSLMIKCNCHHCF